MGVPKSSDSDISNSEKVSKLNKILDQIIRIKRQRHNINERSITDSDREELLMAYRNLEELQNDLKGRVLLEYRVGLRTVTEEVIL